MQAFFILGNNTGIAKLELETLLNTNSKVLETQNVYIADGFSQNLTQIQAKAGGIIKTGILYASAKDQDELIETLASLSQTIRDIEGKFKFGISIYPGGHRGKLAALKTQSEKIGIKVKKKIKESGHSVRYVTSKIPVLSSVIVTKQKLTEKGVEFCLFPTEDEILIGVTETVQDFEEWSTRDYSRPKRDPKRGMLPPKLARSMINLANRDPETTAILDPFCGVGTVLTESLALDFKSITGSDIDEKATHDSRKNINWEKRRSENETEVTLITTKAQEIGTFLAPNSIDLIVTEMFLGTPRSGDESDAVLEKRIKDLEQMLLESLRAFTKILKDKATIVLAVPAYATTREAVTMHIVEKAKLFNFKSEAFTGTDTTQEGAIRYKREGQMVYRDIYKLTFTKK